MLKRHIYFEVHLLGAGRSRASPEEEEHTAQYVPFRSTQSINSRRELVLCLPEEEKHEILLQRPTPTPSG